MKLSVPIACILLFSSLFGAVQAASLIPLTPGQLKELQKKDVLLVDIRTPSEWRQTGLVPGSHPLMYFDGEGHADTDRFLTALEALGGTKDHPVVLICRSGHRSGQLAQILLNDKGYSSVYHLEQGIQGWLKDGDNVVPCSSS